MEEENEHFGRELPTSPVTEAEAENWLKTILDLSPPPQTEMTEQTNEVSLGQGMSDSLLEDVGSHWQLGEGEKKVMAELVAEVQALFDAVQTPPATEIPKKLGGSISINNENYLKLEELLKKATGNKEIKKQIIQLINENKNFIEGYLNELAKTGAEQAVIQEVIGNLLGREINPGISENRLRGYLNYHYSQPGDKSSYFDAISKILCSKTKKYPPILFESPEGGDLMHIAFYLINTPSDDKIKNKLRCIHPMDKLSRVISNQYIDASFKLKHLPQLCQQMIGAKLINSDDLQNELKKIKGEVSQNSKKLEKLEKRILSHLMRTFSDFNSNGFFNGSSLSPKLPDPPLKKMKF